MPSAICIRLACVTWTFLFASATKTCALEVDFEESAAFQVRVSGAIWLRSAPLRLFANGLWHSPVGPNASMMHLSTQRSVGKDQMGSFASVNVSWHVSSEPPMVVHTSCKQYKDLCAVVFTQDIPAGASGTNASNPILPEGHELEEGAHPPIFAFPSFAADASLAGLGFLLWKGMMARAEYGQNVTKHLAGLSSNGPVVLFDKLIQALIISPMDNYKSAVHTASAESWEMGVSSEVESLPNGFVHRTLLIFDVGITRAMDLYGQTLRELHGTRRLPDLNLEFLSYWTDNGAYYYGDAWGQAGGGGPDCNETSMLQVAQGLDHQGLLDSVGMWQLDDWWYPGHPAVYVHCVSNWTLSPPAFNRSLRELSEAIGKPWLLYVPFFCPSNVYRDFRFVRGSSGPTEFAQPHPDDALEFYQMLFDEGLRNAMGGFEQDFLNFNFLAVPLFRKSFGAASRWLGALHQAALERKVPVQLCMALPSDLLESLRFGSATNFRASGDYASKDNYDIGASSLLGFALQLRPSKDSFWTHRPVSAVESGKPWGVKENPGANCELNALIAALSTGPLALADKAGDTNKTLVMRCIRADGRILQPDKPATSIDATFTATGPDSGRIWSTFTGLGGWSWHYVLYIDLISPWQLTYGDFYPELQTSVWRRWHEAHRPRSCAHLQPAVASGCVGLGVPRLLNDRPIMVQNDTRRFDLVQFSPIFPNGWVLLGEVGKYVGVSRWRFLDVSAPLGGLELQLAGAVGEEVRVLALQPSGTREWTILEKQVKFEGAHATLHFGETALQDAWKDVLLRLSTPEMASNRIAELLGYPRLEKYCVWLLATLGGLPYVAKELHQHMAQQPAVDACFCAIIDILDDDVDCEWLLKGRTETVTTQDAPDFVNLVVAAMQQHPQDALVQSRGCHCLALVFQTRLAQHVGELGQACMGRILTIVKEAYNSHYKKEATVRDICYLLRNLLEPSKSPQSNEAEFQAQRQIAWHLVEENMPAQLESSIRHFATYTEGYRTELFESALGALALLKGAGGVLTLLRDLEELPGCAAARAAGIKALFELGSNRPSLLTHATGISVEGGVVQGCQGVKVAVEQLADESSGPQAILLSGLCAALQGC
ncbi:unnamed protein product [Effrenium voratum]|nr:unnamed protein product [Effrenium voratum]